MSLDALAGAWRLKSFVFTDAEGGTFHPLGESPDGALVVTPAGHAVISFMATGRAPFTTDDVFSVGDAERASAAAGYASFGGPCEITDDAITIHVEYSLFPNWVGGTQLRLYELDGDRLTLRTPGARIFGGVERRGEARLERVG